MLYIYKYLQLLPLPRTFLAFALTLPWAVFEESGARGAVGLRWAVVDVVVYFGWRVIFRFVFFT